MKSRITFPHSNLTFGEALEAMAVGKCVRRTRWNDTAFLSHNFVSMYSLSHFRYSPSGHESGRPWYASRDDLGATDWSVFSFANAQCNLDGSDSRESYYASREARIEPLVGAAVTGANQ